MSTKPLLRQVPPVAQLHGPLAFVQVVVEEVADRHGLLDGGHAVVGEPSGVMRSEHHQRIGFVGTATDAGAPSAGLQGQGSSFQAGERALRMDHPQGPAPEADDEGGDLRVAPPPLDRASRDERPAVTS